MKDIIREAYKDKVKECQELRVKAKEDSNIIELLRGELNMRNKRIEMMERKHLCRLTKGLKIKIHRRDGEFMWSIEDNRRHKKVQYRVNIDSNKFHTDRKVCILEAKNYMKEEGLI